MARVGLSAGVTPIGLAAWRLTVASVCLVAYHFGVPKGPLPARSDLAPLALAGSFLGVHFAAWIASLAYVSIARSTLLVATSPLWAGLAGLVVPSLRPHRSFWIGLVIAGLGTWAVVGLDRGGWKGDALALTGAICLVPYLVLSQRVQCSLGWLPTITWIYSAAALCLWILAVAAGAASVPSSLPAWGSILGMALFAQLIGHSGLNWSLKYFTAPQVALATLMEPVFAAALAWPLLGEPITALQALGGLALLAGVGLALIGNRSTAEFEPNL